jgi:nitroreductase
MQLDRSTVDHLLSATRTVRKRLDLTRAVPADVIEECLRLAIQAPTGSNAQGWRWIVVTDAATRRALADLYRRGFGPYLEQARGQRAERAPDEQMQRVAQSAIWLAEHLQDVPVHVIPCIRGRGGAPTASLWGSIYPAVWSFQLALRSRGIGSALTTLHLAHEREAAELLGVPEGLYQAGLLPVAYFTGDDFRPARRRPVEEVVYWERWDAPRR